MNIRSSRPTWHLLKCFLRQICVAATRNSVHTFAQLGALSCLLEIKIDLEGQFHALCLIKAYTVLLFTILSFMSWNSLQSI